MPRADYTDITMILDRSGSMGAIRNATIKGFNDFVTEQKKIPGDGCWSLLQFDDPASARGAGEAFPNVVVDQKPQDAVPALTRETFVPRGNTALIDAVCLTIDAIGRRLADTPEHLRPAKVLVVIMTDGQENSSREFSRDDLNERIAHQRAKYSWQFVFLGANQDAIAEAGKYGIRAGSALTYQATVQGTEQAFQKLFSGTRNWKLEGNDSAAGFFVEPTPDTKVADNAATQTPN